MSTLELPQSSKVAVTIAVAALGIACYRASVHDGASVWLALAAFFISGFVGDLFTGLAHFAFDYVFPVKMPILGPIAKEFREHHECPTLDPSAYLVNFTKGAYSSLPFSLIAILISGSVPFLLTATIVGMSVWALFFHQIHSYSHMGSILPPDEFNRRALEISRLPSKRAQRREFETLFATVPIPPVIRVLQRCRLILNPRSHNLHHILFESNFSSVNGWSDPVTNPVLGPISRRLKARSAAALRA